MPIQTINDMPPLKHVIVLGSALVGLTIIGPFGEHQDALFYAEDNFAGCNWEITALSAPDL